MSNVTQTTVPDGWQPQLRMNHPGVFIDHTNLKPTVTADEMRSLCEDAVEFDFASVCIPPRFVALANNLLYGSEVAVGTVISFPFGYNAFEIKQREIELALNSGANELDIVIPIGMAVEGAFATIESELCTLVQIAQPALVKVILECCYLDDDCKKQLVECAVAAGAAFVKTSTGYGPGGATETDVRLLVRAAAGRIQVKASGGLRDWPTCHAMLVAGASRLGTSNGVDIMRQWLAGQSIGMVAD